MTDISFITDTITIYRKKSILNTPIRYDTENIGIADIIDDTDTIDPSLVFYFFPAFVYFRFTLAKENDFRRNFQSYFMIYNVFVVKKDIYCKSSYCV